VTEIQDNRPAAPPRACRHCGGPAQGQYPRHATDAEYAAVAGDPLRPTDGRLIIAEYACGDHYPDLFCEHPEPARPPCPDCGALPGSPCTRPDGSPRAAEHPGRASALPVAQTCTHAHRPGCGGYGHCPCAADDPDPVRDHYDPPPAVSPPDMAAARQALHEAELDWYAELLRRAGNDPHEAARLARAAFGEFMAARGAADPAPPTQDRAP